jgi:hypothetical protein
MSVGGWSDCRGDYGALAALMSRVWQSNAEQSLDYTPEFLGTCFRYPGASASLSPAYYQDDKPLAFIAGFPRVAQYQGQSLRLALYTFLTAAPEAGGLGGAAWAEALKRARAHGFDGTISYCVEGNRSNDLTVMMARALRLPVQRIYSIRYGMRFLKPQPEPGMPVATVADFLACASRVQAGLTRQWTEEEANWQLTRPGAVSAVWSDGSRRGVVAGYVMRVADKPKTPCLFIDDVLWDDLAATERAALLTDFLARGSAHAQLAVVPYLGHTDTTVLEEARFRRSTRVLNAYLVLWNGMQPAEVPALYMDAF